MDERALAHMNQGSKYFLSFEYFMGNVWADENLSMLIFYWLWIFTVVLDCANTITCSYYDN